MDNNFNNLNDMIAVGVITNVHGVKGLVKVKSFTENPDSLFEYNPVFDKSGNEVEIAKQSVAKGLYIARINGVNDRNSAELLKGNELFIGSQQLPELENGEYYNNQIIGLNVMDMENNKIGEVINMHNYGAGDLVEIKFDETEKSELFLFANDVVEVNVDKNFLVLQIPTYAVTGEKQNVEC